MHGPGVGDEMPIDYRIDHERRLVVAVGTGTITDQDVFSYQRTVWSRKDVAGYNELVDFTAVEHIDVPSAARVKELAVLSAGMDPVGGSSRFAIVAPQDIAYGLGRMYEQFRELDRRSTKEVSVFRTVSEAMEYLGVQSPVD
jgi:hypothetical protein